MVNEGTRYRVQCALELFLNAGVGACVMRLLASAVHSHAYIAAQAPGSTGYVPLLHMTPPPFMLELIQHTSSPFPPGSRPTSSMHRGKLPLVPTRKASFPSQVNVASFPPLLGSIVIMYNSGDEDISRYTSLVCPQGRSSYLIHRLYSADGRLLRESNVTATRPQVVFLCPCSTARTTRR